MTELTITKSERRAKSARLSLCVGFVSILVFLASAPLAHAAPLPPILTNTDPASPGASFTPSVQGVIEEVETKVIQLGAGPRAPGPFTRAASDPDNIVRLYTEAGCAGALVGEGTVAELEDGGIQVFTVDADAVTTFYVTQTSELEGTSPCSTDGLDYRQVTTPPAAPTLDSVNPGSGGNQNFPRLIGSADPEATVSIYPNVGCGGAAVASGSGAQFGSGGIQVSVPDNSETTFSAKASITVNFAGGGSGDFASGCSAQSLLYKEVTPPPTDPGSGGGTGSGGASPGAPAPPPPRLRTLPGGWGNDNTPLVTGSAPGAATVRIYADPSCAGSPVVKATAAELGAGIPIRVVENDVTVLTARSVAGDKVSGCSDPVVYVEDSLAPKTRITMGPAAKTAKQKAIIRFMDTTGNAPGTTFLCRVDRRKWKRCASPLRLRKLRPRRYVVRVKAADPAGNVEAKGAKRSFRVVLRP
jgi:hypothetical protein